MNVIEISKRFAEDFETCVKDDVWSRLSRYLAEDATYENVGGSDAKCKGRDAILTYFKTDVAKFDRRFDSRTLITTSEPIATGNRLSRTWQITYTLQGADDLVLEGQSRYQFSGEQIKTMESELDKTSATVLENWMQRNAGRLSGDES